MKNKFQHKILIINDVTGYGRVSTFAMLPIMSHYGLHPYVLPTALVSNTMDYGDCEILETTDFMSNTIKKWREFGFKFSAISTGFINSRVQANLILSIIEENSPDFLLVDPIMADSGELYPNMNPESIIYYRELISKSDICIPNITEARFLTDSTYNDNFVTDFEISKIVSKFKSLGCKHIVITDCKDRDGNFFNTLFDATESEIHKVYFDKHPRSFVGTGDVFSAVISSELLLGSTLFTAVNNASKFVVKVIEDNKNNFDTFDLIIENSLGNNNA